MKMDNLKFEDNTTGRSALPSPKTLEADFKLNWKKGPWTRGQPAAFSFIC